MRNEKILTMQQLSLYIGSDCMVGKRMGKLMNVDFQRNPSIGFSSEGGIYTREFVEPERIKLILLPLSEADTEKLRTIAKKHEYDASHISRFIDIPTLIRQSDKNDLLSHEEDFRTAVWILNELRALGYDCDDLIEQKLAINRTKI